MNKLLFPAKVAKFDPMIYSYFSKCILLGWVIVGELFVSFPLLLPFMFS